MPLTSIPFLGRDIPTPLEFSHPLPFVDTDKRDMPWLADNIRYYGVEAPLGEGGRAIAYKGFVADRNGARRPGVPPIVLKVPNLDTESYHLEQTKVFLRRLRDDSRTEWRLTRKRLYRCEFANPIFDASVVAEIDHIGELMPMTVTAQMFLDDAVSLNDYLLQIRQRQEPYLMTSPAAVASPPTTKPFVPLPSAMSSALTGVPHSVSKKGVPVDNWRGMSDPAKWIELARCIATGLADIHLRRLVHGDIWPPNVFIKAEADGSNPRVVFIDFGESFSVEPQGDHWEQEDHPYRAPERKDAQGIVTKQADVYSFGKLLLHLAVGQEPILSGEHRGHERREKVRDCFENRNPALANENPFIVDIICKCISVDPVDRPSMIDVLRALNSYFDTKPKVSRCSVPDKLAELQKTWDKVKKELKDRGTSVSPFLEELVQLKMDDIQSMINGLSQEVISLTDTREQLMFVLINLFKRLGAGDRFLSLTSPHLWRGSALGLDGRYFTATAMAVKRGASVQRAFVFSVQEVGDDWAMDLARNLGELNQNNAQPAAGRLASSLLAAIKDYRAALQNENARKLPEDLRSDARRRLSLVIKSYFDASKGVCKSLFDQVDHFQTSAGCRGIYVGLIPVGTLREMRTRKAAHPFSVFFFNAVAKDDDRYLLVMTDCLGRNAVVDGDDKNYAGKVFQRSEPELKGITVFKSVFGFPEDTIKKLEQTFKTGAVGIGHWIDRLHAVLPPWEPRPKPASRLARAGRSL